MNEELKVHHRGHRVSQSLMAALYNLCTRIFCVNLRNLWCTPSRSAALKLCGTLCPLWCIPCILLLFAACDRRDITYYLESELYIRADWKECCLPPEEENHGATTVVFTPAGTSNKQVLMGTRDRETLRVPEGLYNAVIFNRSPDGFAYICFTGDTFETYTAAAREVETRTDPDTRVVTRVLLSTPEDIAADVVTDFTVTEAMLGNYSEDSPMNRYISTRGGNVAAASAADADTRTDTRAEISDPNRYTLHFAPRKLTRKVRVEIHLEGINNVRSTIATVDGVSESVLLSTCQPSAPNAVQLFDLPKLTYDEGSPFNGTLSGEFNVFGFDMDLLHTLTLDFLLVDNVTRVQQTLKAYAEEEVGEDGQPVIILKVSSPEELPTVKPEGDPDSGFDAEVDEWGNPEEEEIPI